MSAPNVLILDEPTNDLDIETLEILEDYLDNFAGIVITVSHDRYFLDRIVDRIFAFEENGQVKQYEGGFSDYYEKAVSSIYNENQNAGLSASQGKSAKTYTKERQQKVKFTYNEQKEYDTIDEDIARLEDEIAGMDGLIAEAATQYSRLNELMQEKAEREQQLEEKMERWVYLNDLAEKIEQGRNL
jgi:ATP-binding cassette subfamily F protein uup